MIDTNYFKQKLEEEKKDLEKDLADIATNKLTKEDNWQAVPEDREMDIEMRDEVADKFESLESRQAAEGALEERLRHVEDALKRIEEGNYGKCKINGEEIEKERLEANPAASTCKAHINEE